MKKLVDLNLELRTERLFLRPLNEDDAEDVFKYTTDKEMTKYLTWEAYEGNKE